LNVTKQDDAIELVQITDPHLYADTSEGLYGVKSFQTFQAVVAEAVKLKPQLALLTGDLVHDETEQGYSHLRQALQPLNVPSYLIPGNHDDFAFMQAEFSGGQISCEKRIKLGNWQILMLNSQVPGQVIGHLDEKELKWLEQCLRDSGDLYSMVVLHHNPVPVGCKWLDPLGLDNADKLFELIAAQPQVKAVVCGHVHQEFSEERAGVQLMSTPSTCIQFKPGVDDFELDYLAPGYRWFRLHADGTLETEVKRLSKVPDGLDPSAKGYSV
jgi:Icc protein